MDEFYDFKKCTYCNIYLPLVDFYVRLGKKTSRCKECIKLAHKLDYIKFRDRINNYSKNRRQNDLEYKQKCNLSIRQSKKKIKSDPVKREKYRKYYRTAYYKNIERCKFSRRKSYLKHIDSRREYARKYYKNNREKIRAYERQHKIKRRKTDHIYDFCLRMREALRRGLKKLYIQKKGKTFSLLGFTKLELNDHLSKFLNKPCAVCELVIISQENKNYDIDHIKPLCSASTYEEILSLNQLDNLRLICSKCNSNKISEDLKQKATRG